MPPVSKTSLRSVDQFASPPLYTKTSSQEHEQEQPSDDIWLTVSEIPPFIKPTKAPPPSRPPPPIPRHTSKSERGYSGKYPQSHNPFQASPLDEFETFAMDRAEAKFRHAKGVREREHAKGKGSC